MTKAGSGPEEPDGEHRGDERRGDFSCAEYCVATSSATTALKSNTAVSGLTTSSTGDKVAPTIPTHTIALAIDVARAGR
jgi:hypothetical protein